MLLIKKSTLLHLRIPFSYYLMPVFLFVLATLEEHNWGKVLLVFLILHLFVYPASNGYNSYFDKDEGSIGGLKRPPKVDVDLYQVSLIFDLIGILLALFISWWFVGMVLVYGLVSKAYSHPSVRLKKYPFASWLTAGIFQGYFTWIMVYAGLSGIVPWELGFFRAHFPALLSSALLLGSYPMTQIYQHEEDKERGDITLSLKLGILGTFYFVAFVFLLANAGFLWYFYSSYSSQVLFIYLGITGPILAYFLVWYLKVRKDLSLADFDNTMRMNFISSTCFNLFFLLLALAF